MVDTGLTGPTYTAKRLRCAGSAPRDQQAARPGSSQLGTMSSPFETRIVTMAPGTATIRKPAPNHKLKKVRLQNSGSGTQRLRLSLRVASKWLIEAVFYQLPIIKSYNCYLYLLTSIYIFLSYFLSFDSGVIK